MNNIFFCKLKLIFLLVFSIWIAGDMGLKWVSAVQECFLESLWEAAKKKFFLKWPGHSGLRTLFAASLCLWLWWWCFFFLGELWCLLYIYVRDKIIQLIHFPKDLLRPSTTCGCIIFLRTLAMAAKVMTLHCEKSHEHKKGI